MDSPSSITPMLGVTPPSRSSSLPPALHHGREKAAPLRSLLTLFTALVAATVGMYLLLLALLPEDPVSGGPLFTFPTDVDSLKKLAFDLEEYAAEQPLSAAAAFTATYLYFRAFSIPGCLPLNFLAGYLFGLPFGLALVCACTAVGASLCYLNSAWVIGPTVRHYLAHRIASWSLAVAKERANLFSYLLILRLLPILPSWFVSLAAPHLQIPLPTFFAATLVGAIVPSFVHVQAGRALQSLDSLSGLVTLGNTLAIIVVILLALAPVLARKYSAAAAAASSSPIHLPLSPHLPHPDGLGFATEDPEEEDRPFPVPYPVGISGPDSPYSQPRPPLAVALDAFDGDEEMGVGWGGPWRKRARTGFSWAQPRLPWAQTSTPGAEHV